jgi:hypothetical protein
MAITPEGKVKLAVKKWLTERGIWYFMPVSNGMGRHGIPDLLCCHQGRFLGLEIKAPGKRRTVTPNQIRELIKIKQAGGVALIIDDVQQLATALGEPHDRQPEAPRAGPAPAGPQRGAEVNPDSQVVGPQRPRADRRAAQTRRGQALAELGAHPPAPG